MDDDNKKAALRARPGNSARDVRYRCRGRAGQKPRRMGVAIIMASLCGRSLAACQCRFRDLLRVGRQRGHQRLPCRCQMPAHGSFNPRRVSAEQRVDVVEDRDISLSMLFDAGRSLDERMLAEQFSA